MMFFHYRTVGVFLKKEDRAESDQLFTVYTKDFGKLEILGKAIRKISSKLRGGADIFYLSEIEFIRGKTYKILTDAILIDKFPNLKNNLNKLKVAYQIAEILDKLVFSQETDERIWQLLKETFKKLNELEVENQKLELLYYYFFWNLVSFLGYQPKIENCTIQSQKIDCNVIKILKIILKRDWEILPRLKLEDRYLKLLKKISRWYQLNYATEK